MPTTFSAPTFDVLARRAIACLVLAGSLPAAAATIPQPVSPGAHSGGVVAEARCPTFSWAGVPGARGYQLAVFRVSDAPDAQPVLVTRASVPGDARGWTPPVGQCLERGQRYAWSVAVAADAPDWSPPFLFEIEAAPSIEEVEQAIATLQRYRDRHAGDEPASAAFAKATADVPEPLDGGSSRAPRRTRERPTLLAADSPTLPGALTSPTSGVVRVASAATPTLGIPSLKVSANVALGASTNLFKDGAVFLWDDTDGNTSLGRNALSSVSGSATNNTALGREALHNTTGGAASGFGSNNTAVGDRALHSNNTGFRNTASGAYALRFNTTGSRNTASGYSALRSNTTGYSNTASGHSALQQNIIGGSNTASGFAALLSNTTGHHNTANGVSSLSSNTSGYLNTASGNEALCHNTTGHHNTANGSAALSSNTTGISNTASGAFALDSNTIGNRNTASGYAALYSNTMGYGNTALGTGAGFGNTIGSNSIFINNVGVASDTATIKIGTQGTQMRTFIAGIRGITTFNANGVAVLIDSAGQLGTVSSSRAVKQDIQDLGTLDERLLELRPVAFRYKQHVVSDPDTPLEFGFIAEEVAEVFPELVVYDEDGKPETIKYHLLSSLLVRQIQEQHDELARQGRLVERQQAELRRLAALLERRGSSAR